MNLEREFLILCLALFVLNCITAYGFYDLRKRVHTLEVTVGVVK